MANGWYDFFNPEEPAPVPIFSRDPVGRPPRTQRRGEPYHIPDIKDIPIPEERKEWFAAKFKDMKQRHPYRTDRDILQNIFIELGYLEQEERRQKQGQEELVETIQTGPLPDVFGGGLDALGQGWNYLQGLRGEIGMQIPGAPALPQGPLEAPRANIPMPRPREAGTIPAFGGGVPGGGAPIEKRPVEGYDFFNPPAADILAPVPQAQAPVPQAAMPTPEQGAARMELPAPPVKPDFVERLRGIVEAAPKTTADILPRRMAPTFKNPWLEALRFSLPAVTGHDPYKVEADRQKVLDDQWFRDFAVAKEGLNFKQQAELKILERQMVDYESANAGYREVLKELGNRYPGIENNPNFLSAVMQTYHMPEKVAKEFMEANKRADGTINLGLDKKAQKIQEIKTQIEILREFLPGYPDDMLADRVLGGQFKITVDGIKGSLLATIISPNTPVEKKRVAMEQLKGITKMMEATGESGKIADKLGLLYKMRDAIVPTQGQKFFDDLVTRTWQHEFGGVPPEPKEKEPKWGEEQKRLQFTQTTTGWPGIYFSRYPQHLGNKEAFAEGMGEWDKALIKYTAGQEALDMMAETTKKPVTPEQESTYWKAHLTPKEFAALNDIKEGLKRYLMKDMATGDLRRDPNGRPRGEILAIIGNKLTLDQWQILVGWIELRDATGKPAVSNEKILQVLGVGVK